MRRLLVVAASPRGDRSIPRNLTRRFVARWASTRPDGAVVERDLMLIKLDAPPSSRAELQSLVQIFRARIVDVSPDQIMVEISGQERKIEAFIDAVRPYGIRELARTGRIAHPAPGGAAGPTA